MSDPFNTELLEPRRLFAAGAANTDSLLLVEGTKKDDVIVLSIAPKNENKVKVTINGKKIGTINPVEDSIKITAKAGNDEVHLDEASGRTFEDFLVTLLGGTGDDTLVGGSTAVKQIVNGGVGNDTLSSGTALPESENLLTGGKGHDSITGGSGIDSITGDSGNDTLGGNAANDILSGGTGNDYLVGGDGADEIHGDAGDDTLLTGPKQDNAFGDDGTDTIDGNPEQVIDVTGTDGPDTVFITVTNSGTKVEVELNDVLIHTLDNNPALRLTVSTLGGADEIRVIENGFNLRGVTHLMGGDNGDTIESGSERSTIEGGAGSDVILGGDGLNFLYGGIGADTITGGNDDDVIDGGVGNDIETDPNDDEG